MKPASSTVRHRVWHNASLAQLVKKRVRSNVIDGLGVGALPSVLTRVSMVRDIKDDVQSFIIEEVKVFYEAY